MDFKALGKALLPPVAVDVYRRFFRPFYKDGYLWRGVYESFTEVPERGRGYDSELWIASRVAQMAHLNASYAMGGAPPLSQGFRYAALGLLASLVLEAKGLVRILDLGGALGIGYQQIQRSLNAPPGKIDYYVVDSERSVQEGERLFGGDSSIHFLSSLHPRLEGVDIVFLSGALQYVSDFRGMISVLAEYRAPHVLLTYLSAGDVPTYASAQVNLRQSVLAAWFINLEELKLGMARAGYHLVYRVSAEPEDRIDMRNFPETHRLEYMTNLLFALGEGGII